MISKRSTQKYKIRTDNDNLYQTLWDENIIFYRTEIAVLIVLQRKDRL